MTHAFRALPGLLLAATLAAPGTARAASPAAEALFEEGRRLMEAGQLDEACAKFGASFAREVTSGTLLNLALCHEKQGKVATAWAEYRAAARLAHDQGRLERAAAAEQRSDSLAPRLPRLTLVTARPLADMALSIDAQSLGAGALGAAVPLDPGSHQVSVGAPRFRAWSTQVDLVEGEQRTLAIPPLEPDPTAQRPAPAPVGVEVVPRPRDQRAERQSPPRSDSPSLGRSSSASLAGWITIGAGTASIAAGTVLGLMSLAAYRAAEHACPTRQDCSSAAMSDRRRADGTAWASDITLGAGLVAVGVGSVLVLSPGSGKTRASAWVLPRPDGVGIALTAALP